MPDPELRTVSASQAPALLGLSPYATRYMLYRKFADGFDTDPPDDERMAWGRRLQPAILAATAEQLALEVRPNEGDAYRRHGALDGSTMLPIGCTLDGEIIDPARGSGIVQVKCVDRAIFAHDWGQGIPPAHMQVQVQTEMLVIGAQWGVLAVLVGGNHLELLDLAPNEEMQQVIGAQATIFMDQVAKRRPPDPDASPIELDCLRAAAGRVAQPPLDLSADRAFLGEVVTYQWARDQATFAGKTKNKGLALILAKAEGHAEILLHGGGRLSIKATEITEQTVHRKAHQRVTVKVRNLPDDLMAPFRGEEEDHGE